MAGANHWCDEAASRGGQSKEGKGRGQTATAGDRGKGSRAQFLVFPQRSPESICSTWLAKLSFKEVPMNPVEFQDIQWFCQEFSETSVRGQREIQGLPWNMQRRRGQ